MTRFFFWGWKHIWIYISFIWKKSFQFFLIISNTIYIYLNIVLLYIKYILKCSSSIHHSVMTVACHAPLSMEFSRQENWIGLCTLQQLQRVGSEVSVPRLESTGSVVLTHGLVTSQDVGSSSPTRDQTRVSCIGRPILNHCTTREASHTYLYHLVYFPGYTYLV